MSFTTGSRAASQKFLSAWPARSESLFLLVSDPGPAVVFFSSLLTVVLCCVDWPYISDRFLMWRRVAASMCTSSPSQNSGSAAGWWDVWLRSHGQATMFHKRHVATAFVVSISAGGTYSAMPHCWRLLVWPSVVVKRQCSPVAILSAAARSYFVRHALGGGFVTATSRFTLYGVR